VLVSKGSLWTYPIGIIQVLAYAWTSYISQLYSEAILQIYFMAIQIIGWVAWAHHMDNKTHEVKKHKLSRLELILWGIGTVVFVIVYHYFLKYINSALPLHGSMATSLSIIAMLLMVIRSKWQWFVWLIVNVISIIMWVTQGEYLMAFLFVFYITNNVYGWYKWRIENE
jgi:nicotinamide mononucleotide transporter